jgi:hypothetical protein
MGKLEVLFIVVIIVDIVVAQNETKNSTFDSNMDGERIKRGILLFKLCFKTLQSLNFPFFDTLIPLLFDAITTFAYVHPVYGSI